MSRRFRRFPKSQRGATGILLPLSLIFLLAVGAFAVDLNNVLVSRAELQNAADAGALEGARQLYSDDGTVNTTVGSCGTSCDPCGADPACEAAEGSLGGSIEGANDSQGTEVEVVYSRRGHWTFVASLQENGIERGGLFTANSNSATAPTWDSTNGNFRPLVDTSLGGPALSDCSGADPSSNLNTDVNRDTCDFNAVRVCVARSDTPIASFFARLVGITEFDATACAVAYVGFAGSINPAELDAPIALCEHLLIQDGEYNCQIGRWNTSSSGDEGAAKWTDFDQSSCNAASASVVGSLIDAMTCDGSTGINTDALEQGTPINVTGTGVAQSNLTTLFEKWKTCVPERTCTDPDGNNYTSSFPTRAWTLKLPVVDCDDASNSACNPLFAAVEVQVIWENNQQSDSGFPVCMEDVQGFDNWYSDYETENRWGDPVVPDTESECLNPPSGSIWEWDEKDGKCIDTKEYSIGTEVVYDGDKEIYDREEQIWDSFVRHFQLSRNTTDECTDAGDDCGWWVGDIKQPFADNESGYRDKAVYFSPSCEGLELGGTGGTITFLRARVPVLVY